VVVVVVVVVVMMMVDGTTYLLEQYSLQVDLAELQQLTAQGCSAQQQQQQQQQPPTLPGRHTPLEVATHNHTSE